MLVMLSQVINNKTSIINSCSQEKKKDPLQYKQKKLFTQSIKIIRRISTDLKQSEYFFWPQQSNQFTHSIQME